MKGPPRGNKNAAGARGPKRNPFISGLATSALLGASTASMYGHARGYSSKQLSYMRAGSVLSGGLTNAARMGVLGSALGPQGALAGAAAGFVGGAAGNYMQSHAGSVLNQFAKRKTKKK